MHAAEDAYRCGDAPIGSVEGFVRQVLGWREYVWHLYWHFGKGYPRRNALHAHTPLPEWWTGLDAAAVTAKCLATALEGVRDRGWTHHIQRLMVLGNHALQRGYRPRELSDWFREAFVDGFEWVMPVRVIGMSAPSRPATGPGCTPPRAARRQPAHRPRRRVHGAAGRSRRRAGAGVRARGVLTPAARLNV